ncbi:hypothetical protein AQUCO_00200753v1 [Aquilegia coerulea]|uniref:DUF863 domain-containing protein n=1 Tax=Aquilegia coerulea TaxID=218851 RepID=A0A2G5F4J7_AQUCA|nr:hypothetical protein AQUCO_00200753v1 [Aquilegia coerulea]
MGTKVHCKSYFPGYCSMRDLNEDADSGSWPMYHEDKMLMARQYYNDFLPRPATDGYSEYDKEVLRQTMLKHEATFKNQVSELHRVYRIQRNLMEELKRKEVHNTIPMEASQSMYHSSSSQMPSEHAFKIWDGNPSCSRPSFSGTENRQSPSEIIKSSNMQGHAVTNGSFRDCRLLDSNSKKPPRRMFDLQLPADQYIDDEEGEKVLTPDNNVNWSLGSGRNLKRQAASSKSDLSFRNKQSLADLNHPIQGEEAASSASASNFLGPVACRIDTQVQDTLQKNSGSLGLPREIFHNTPRGMNNGTHSNGLHLDMPMASRLEWPSYNFENGQSRRKLNYSSQGFGAEESPTTSKPIQAEFSNRSETVVHPNFSRSLLETRVPISYPAVPAVAESGLSSFSSWKKPASGMSQSSIAVQPVHSYSSNSSAQLSKISDTSNRKNGLCEPQWQINRQPRVNSCLANGISYPNGSLQRSQLEPNASEDRMSSVGFDYLSCSRDNASPSVHYENHSTTKYFKGSECMDVKSAKDLNLNIAIPNGFMEGMVPEGDILIIDGEKKNNDPVGGLPWLKRKSACSNGSAKGREALNEKGFCLSHSQFTPKVGSEKVLTPHSVQDSSSTSIACDAEDQMIQKSDSPRGKKILGVSIFDKTHISKEFPSLNFSSPSIRDTSEVEAITNVRKPETLNIDLSFDPALLALGQKLSSKHVSVAKDLDKGTSSVKNNFNLNSCADEEEPCTYSVRRETIRIEIDLEAPPVPEASEVMSPEEESVDQLEISAQLSQVELQDQSEELARNVAEAIVTISSSCFHSEDLTCHPSGKSLDDSLRWFADIVSSQTEGLGGKNEVVSREKYTGDDDELSSSSSDYFETMTLKLAETKVDEYFRKPWEPEPQNEEEACVSALVPTRRRRGQARRGRQRRDFQRDILPGLASLSRFEVSEDIQVIGGLMRATGHSSWQTGVAKRNAARNGWARGRRRTRNVAPAVAATIVCSPPRQQANNSELGLEERSLTGWGKTTRRPRRQRLAAGNISIPITQV